VSITRNAEFSGLSRECIFTIAPLTLYGVCPLGGMRKMTVVCERGARALRTKIKNYKENALHRSFDLRADWSLLVALGWVWNTRSKSGLVRPKLVVWSL
jgi:hypothetical protein